MSEKRIDYNMTTSVGVGKVADPKFIEASEGGDGHLHRTIITLKNLPITVGNTTGISFGGTKIYDFPAGRLLILTSQMRGISIGLTNAGNATPITGAMGGDMSLGTTAPSDGTLTTTDVDFCPSTSIDPISGGITGAALAASTQFDGTGTAKDLYINMLIDDADVGNAASDVLEISGEVEVVWINGGDY